MSHATKNVLPYKGMPGENLEIALEAIEEKIGVAGLRHIVQGTGNPYEETLPTTASPGPRPVRNTLSHDMYVGRSLFADDETSEISVASSQRPGEGEAASDDGDINNVIAEEFGSSPEGIRKGFRKDKVQKSSLAAKGPEA